jgi:predicted metal-dependent RNase
MSRKKIKDKRRNRMKIDLSTEILGLDDKPFTTGEVKTVQKTDDAGELVFDANQNPVMVSKPVALTMRAALLMAYVNPPTPQQTINLTEKVARGAMAMRLHSAKRFIEFTTEEISKAKTLVSDVIGSPVAMLRIVSILDPASVPKEPLAAVDDEAEAKA